MIVRYSIPEKGSQLDSLTVGGMTPPTNGSTGMRKRPFPWTFAHSFRRV
jgi:hypothetical protein